MKAIIASGSSYLGMKLYSKGISGGPPLVDRDSTGSGVSAGDDPLPSQVCGLLRWQAGIGGPKGRGRDYMPFPSQEFCSSTGVMSGAYQGLIATVGGILFGPHVLPNVGGAGGTLNVFPCTKYVAGSPTPLPYAFQSFEAATGFATQKRRGYYGQTNTPSL